MWYERLDVLWDGADYLALIFRGKPSSRSPAGALRVRAARTSAQTPRLIAVVGQTGQARVHILRLPTEHRFVTVSPDGSAAPSLDISLEETIAPGGGAEWRLILLHAAANGEPALDSASQAAPQRSAQDVFDELRQKRLRVLRNRRDGPASTPVWGVRCMERWVRSAKGGRVSASLAVSPVETIFPEERHIAPIGIEPAVTQLSVLDKEAANSAAAPANPDMPAVARTIELERARRPVHGFRLRTSREDPTVQWIQRRSAVVHVRRQVKMPWSPQGDSSGASEPQTEPFSDKDIDQISAPRTVPLGEPAIRSCSLSQVLSRLEPPMAGVTLTSHRGTGETIGPADEAVLWFDGAALGDDIGLVSTRDGVLKRLSSNGPDGDATGMLMFRIGPDGLLPIDLPADEKDELEKEAARVQADDTDIEGNAPDDERRAIDAARHSLDAWYSEKLGSPVPYAFDGLEPLLSWSAADLLAKLRRAGGDHQRPVFELFRRDPAICAALIARGSDAQLLRYVAGMQLIGDGDLLPRLAQAYDASGLIADDGVMPEAELEALDILNEENLRGELLASRISLDASTRGLRAGARQALSKLADRKRLDAHATSLEQRNRAGQAASIRKFLKLPGTPGEWIALAGAVALAKSLDTSLAERKRVSEEIEAIGTSDSTVLASTSASRPRAEILGSIEKALIEGEPLPSIEARRLAEIRRLFEQEENLDDDQLLRLDGTASTLVYGPARDRLINDLLERLVAWARLPPDFLAQMIENYVDALARSKLRDGAEAFKKRVETLQGWTMPERAEPNDKFTHRRIALRRELVEKTDKRASELGIDETRSGDFEQLVIPVGDLFLHHRAFLGLRTVSAAARSSQGTQDERAQGLARQLERGLVKWPRDAAETWKAGSDLASRIDAAGELEEALRLPALP